MKFLAFSSLCLLGTAQLFAQERIRVDVGYGGAPDFKVASEPYKGLHVAAAVEMTWADLGVLFVRREIDPARYGYGFWRDLTSSTTTAIGVGQTWRTSRASLSVFLGLGAFFGRVEAIPFFGSGEANTVSKETLLAIPFDVRMCWEFGEHVGVGAAVFGVRVPPYSHVGYHLFGRVLFW